MPVRKKQSTLRVKQRAAPVLDRQAAPPSLPCSIVGIGASAGGLEALEAFLQNVQPASGLAYVIVQHLDPTHKAIIAELLQRSTQMPVVEVADRTRVKPDCVYVIPPNKDMSVLHGVLHLLAPAAPHGLRMPIDFFFRALADDQQERSIGVILSGMGSDGTLGLRAIKVRAGVTFVQEPSSARFDGMPRSAVASGLADVVAPVQELPGKIAAYVRTTRLAGAVRPVVDELHAGVLDKIVLLLRAQTGHDFSAYKKTTICRRIERRMGIHQIDKITDYVRFLRENPKELELLFKELLIGVTSFFRDPAAWDQLKNKILPALMAAHKSGGSLRAWVPGCSTGEEAYSLAISFLEAVEEIRPKKPCSLQIFATDLDPDAIDRARAGIFAANLVADISPERLGRYFSECEQGYKVTTSVRELVVFATQNLIMDPPFTKLDILICRNVLIYLTTEMQKKLIPLFHYSLQPGGCLFLGSAETIGGFSELFAPVDGKLRQYRRLEPPVPKAASVAFPSSFSRPPQGAPALPGTTAASPSLQAMAEQLLLQNFSPAAVLVSDGGDILYISGKTGRYLEPAAGKANWNIFAMAREGLRYELADAFKAAVRDQQPVRLEQLRMRDDRGAEAVDIIVHPVVASKLHRGLVMIVFRDVPAQLQPETVRRPARRPMDRHRLEELERELAEARQEALGMREEMQTSQEELKSANEELQSTNEELQSTNEELTTSKEELQSLNEELQTLNHELLAKVDELSQASNDMKNLLESTNIATLFLDDALNIRRFTAQAAKIIKLIPGDVGRPITDIVTQMVYPAFADDVRDVLRTLVFREKDITTRDGHWYSVRIMPYRTIDNRIDGVVITFSDVTTAKHLEARLRNAPTKPGSEQEHRSSP